MNQGYLFSAPKEFFKKELILRNFTRELKKLENQFPISSRDESKAKLNGLRGICLDQSYDKILLAKLHLTFISTVLNYALHYESKATFENILSNLNNEQLKQVFATKFPFEYKFYSAHAHFGIFNSNYGEKEYSYTLKELDNLIKAKFYLTKLYSNHLSKKHTLSQTQLFNCLHILSGVLSQLSRWTEPFYYFNTLTLKENESHQALYLKVLTLESVKEKTCLNFNGLLLLKILDYSRDALKTGQLIEQQERQLKNTSKEIRHFCKEKKIKITELRKHLSKIKKDTYVLKTYESFCVENHLYLNEHVFFCNCKKSMRDDIKIETSHAHTKIKWVEERQRILDLISYEYILSRNNFYQSLDSTKIYGQNLSSIRRGKAQKKELKNSMLVAAFKGCYSILDKIGISILEALNIDHKSITKNLTGQKRPIPIYFLNMWDYDLIKENHFDENFYLFSLYSIAKDLDKTKFSALSEFKSLRNSMEHNILIISDNPIEKKEGDIHYISKESLHEKCKLLLILTKSAIFSYTYFLRRQSILINSNSQNKPKASRPKTTCPKISKNLSPTNSKTSN